MLGVVEGVSPGEAADAVQSVADIAVAADTAAADIAAQSVDDTAAGTADAVALVDIVGSDIAAALVVG